MIVMFTLNLCYYFKHMAKKDVVVQKRKMRKETVQGIWAIIFFVVGVIFVLAAMDKAGVVGSFLYQNLSGLIGFGYFLLPVVCFMVGLSFLKADGGRRFPVLKIIGALLFFFSGLGFIDLAAPSYGGIIGYSVSMPFLKLFEIYSSIIILGAIFVSAILIVFETRLTFEPLAVIWKKVFNRKKMRIRQEENDPLEEFEKEKTGDENQGVRESETTEEDFFEEEISEGKTGDFIKNDRKETGFRWTGVIYAPPPLSLLERDKGKPIVGDIKANANIIKRTLQNFGISVEMDEVSIGPSITRYSLKPAEGVKLSKIAALQDNLAYALAAHPIRIEAPIPGKSLVGIEIPNSTKSLVGLASMLGSEEFQNSGKSLLVSLGKSISGKAHFGDLAKMPHLLLAGATGSGKSVSIHTIINSLLFRNSPENLKFIMIDPKRVELTLYNKIPHLLTPVVTDAKKAILALKWAAKEMERRYAILEAKTARDIDSYHKNILEPEFKKLQENRKSGGDDTRKELPDLMPYIIIVIDELADIMLSYPRELEAAVVRLAQMSRAVGIHLILSTQRPSVDVITGLIKANISARIALQVSSQIDSRTILDCSGAEKLLGAGDMLYLGGDMSRPERLQSAFISEAEVKKVVKYLKEEYINELPDELDLAGDTSGDKENGIFETDFDESEEIDDILYESAREEVIKAGKASTSYIQRKLRVGYARAARLVDMLEERGVIGPADGARPREVINPISQDKEETAV